MVKVLLGKSMCVRAITQQFFPFLLAPCHKLSMQATAPLIRGCWGPQQSYAGLQDCLVMLYGPNSQHFIICWDISKLCYYQNGKHICHYFHIDPIVSQCNYLYESYQHLCLHSPLRAEDFHWFPVPSPALPTVIHIVLRGLRTLSSSSFLFGKCRGGEMKGQEILAGGVKVHSHGLEL